MRARLSALEGAGLCGARPSALEGAGLRGARPSALDGAGLRGARPSALEGAGLRGARLSALEGAGLHEGAAKRVGRGRTVRGAAKRMVRCRSEAKQYAPQGGGRARTAGYGIGTQCKGMFCARRGYMLRQGRSSGVEILRGGGTQMPRQGRSFFRLKRAAFGVYSLPGAGIPPRECCGARSEKSGSGLSGQLPAATWAGVRRADKNGGRVRHGKHAAKRRKPAPRDAA